MLSKVRNTSHTFRRDAGWKFCRQNRGCWVEIISTQHQPGFPCFENPVIHLIKRLLFGYALFYVFCSIPTITKISQSSSQIINDRDKFLDCSPWPGWMLGGIPPCITVSGVKCAPWFTRKLIFAVHHNDNFVSTNVALPADKLLLRCIRLKESTTFSADIIYHFVNMGWFCFTNDHLMRVTYGQLVYVSLFPFGVHGYLVD